MELPRPNTPRILESKKKRIRRIWLCTAGLCAGCFSAFLISIHTAPPAPFWFSICSIALPFPILFSSVLLHAHIRYFPEFDYGDLTPEQIRALPVSPQYRQECRQLLGRKVLLFLLVVIFAVLEVLSATPGRDPAPSLRRLAYVTDFLPILGLVFTTQLLRKAVMRRRQLELVKYRRE